MKMKNQKQIMQSDYDSIEIKKYIGKIEKKLNRMENGMKMLYAVTEKIITELEKKQTEPQVKLEPLNPDDYKHYIG